MKSDFSLAVYFRQLGVSVRSKVSPEAGGPPPCLLLSGAQVPGGDHQALQVYAQGPGGSGGGESVLSQH